MRSNKLGRLWLGRTDVQFSQIVWLAVLTDAPPQWNAAGATETMKTNLFIEKRGLSVVMTARAPSASLGHRPSAGKCTHNGQKQRFSPKNIKTRHSHAMPTGLIHSATTWTPLCSFFTQYVRVWNYTVAEIPCLHLTWINLYTVRKDPCSAFQSFPTAE